VDLDKTRLSLTIGSAQIFNAVVGPFIDMEADAPCFPPYWRQSDGFLSFLQSKRSYRRLPPHDQTEK